MDSSPSSSSTLQQFCLRWHNHQASLLSSLPMLLDQSHLTDVTLSAEGRTVRAHRVVLSACSTFFSELFRTLEPPFHPVIVLPGASFGALVALLTFMYSGEVNVYEEQISTLLALAETLGIKGLADFNGQNVSKSSPKSETSSKESPEITAAHQPTKPTSSPFENIFNKSFQFYPNLMQQPLNYSAKQCDNENANHFRYLSAKINAINNNNIEHNNNNNNINSNNNNNCNNNDDEMKKHLSSSINENLINQQLQKKTKLSDMRKIDKIAESLRGATTSKNFLDLHHHNHPKLPLILPQGGSPSPFMLKSPLIASLPHNFLTDDLLMMQKSDLFHDAGNHTMRSGSETPTHDSGLEKVNNTQQSPNVSKTANSKLYATCFICHKQLSNQYNLRVHLETHQNVRYACTVCTHVSRSKDALRKHVSYRHPGAPSPCGADSMRKRAKHAQQQSMIKQEILEQTASALQQMISPSITQSQITQMSPPSNTPTPPMNLNENGNILSNTEQQSTSSDPI